MKDKYWCWVQSIRRHEIILFSPRITNINSQIAPFSNNVCPLFPISLKTLNGKGKQMFSRSGDFHWELAYNVRPRIAPGPSYSPEWKQSSSRREVFSLLEDLRKKRTVKSRSAKQARQSNRSAQKKNKPIVKSINSMYGKLFLYLLDANVVITTTMLKKKSYFSQVTSQIPPLTN